MDAMTRPGFYSDRPSQVEVKQTAHVYLVLAGEYVYKANKPVHFDFADCSTLGAPMGSLARASLP